MRETAFPCRSTTETWVVPPARGAAGSGAFSASAFQALPRRISRARRAAWDGSRNGGRNGPLAGASSGEARSSSRAIRTASRRSWAASAEGPRTSSGGNLAEDLQRLGEDPARGGRADAHDVAVAVPGPDRLDLADRGGDAGEVVAPHEPAVRPHVRVDLRRDPAGVEVLRARLRETPERAGERREPQPVSRRRRGRVAVLAARAGQEDRAEEGRERELAGVRPEQHGLVPRRGASPSPPPRSPGRAPRRGSSCRSGRARARATRRSSGSRPRRGGRARRRRRCGGASPRSSGAAPAPCRGRRPRARRRAGSGSSSRRRGPTPTGRPRRARTPSRPPRRPRSRPAPRMRAPAREAASDDDTTTPSRERSGSVASASAREARPAGSGLGRVERTAVARSGATRAGKVRAPPRRSHRVRMAEGHPRGAGMSSARGRTFSATTGRCGREPRRSPAVGRRGAPATRSRRRPTRSR